MLAHNAFKVALAGELIEGLPVAVPRGRGSASGIDSDVRAGLLSIAPYAG